MGSDAAPDSALHAQAVRFLTTLRSHASPEDAEKPLSVTDDQREFLRGKGMSDEQIERARHDAERPENLQLTDAYMAMQHHEHDIDALYDRAKRAFDEPIDRVAPPAQAVAEPPPVPPASYPSSPLALYSVGQAPPRDANEVLSNYAATLMKPRYDVLINFFRVLQRVLMLGGILSTAGVMLYRRYVLPRLSEMIDARTNLVHLQLEQFGRLAELVTGLRANRVGALLPPRYEPTWIEVPAEAASETKAEGENTETAPAEVPDAEKASAASAAASETPSNKVDESAEAPESEALDAEDADVEPAEPVKKLAPIDVTAPLRNALDTLQHTLRLAARAQCGERRAPLASVSDDLEADDDGLIDLGAPESVSSHESEANSPIPPVAPTRAMRSLNGTMESFRNDVRARLLEEEDALSAVGSRFSAFGLGQARAATTPQPAAEMQQIKAEIRSLKGLMLSRRNFPSYMHASRVTPSFSSYTSTST
ncbi:hypothetical protein CBS9595_001634 [Malassezia furfur]|nr:hypothetical protein CBS9595_001634 [Malassezia furfur]